MPSSRLATIAGDLPIASTSGPSASASTARRATNWATSGSWPFARMLEGQRRIVGDERLDPHPQQLRQVRIGGVVGVRQQTIGDVPTRRAIEALQG